MTLDEVARRAVDETLSAGASDAEAWAEESTSRRIRVYRGEVESLSDAGGRGVGVRAFAGARSGYAYGTDLSAEGVAEVARAAAAAAEVSDEDDHEGLPAEFGTTPVDGLASTALGNWSTERKVELALAIERAARANPGVSQVENAVYSDAEGAVALMNSRGFSASYEATQAWAYASAFAGEGADLMTGMGVGLGRDPEALDPEEIGSEAAERAVALVGARQPSSRRCPVVLDSFVAASFLGFIGAMLSADAVQRGRSLFAGREGDEVADPAVVLADDGAVPDGPASAPFDGEGSPTRRTPLIEDGRLSGFLYDARTARRARPPHHRQRRPRLVPVAAGRGHHEPRGRARHGRSRRARAHGRRRALCHRGGRAALGGQPGVRHLLGGRLGAPDRGWAAGRTGPRDDHRQRPREHAHGGARGRLPGPLGALRRQRQGPSDPHRRDGRFRFLRPGKTRNERGFRSPSGKYGVWRPGSLLRCGSDVAPGKEEIVTKAEFVDRVADNSGLGKGEAGKAVDAVLDSIQEVLSRGGEINFTGFGKFSVADRSARQGVNPQTGEKIQIAASRVPRFSAGSALKSAVKGS